MITQDQERARESTIEALKFYLQQAFPQTIVEISPDKDSRGTIFCVNDSEGTPLHRAVFTHKVLDDTREPSLLIAQLQRWELISKMKKAGTSFVRVDYRGIYSITESS